MKKAENTLRTPFSTALSGSAHETELRIRNIFQWKKKRPPLWLMALALAAILACGGLVSCQQAGRDVPTLVMDVQYYDTAENYIEIPALVPPEGTEPDPGVTAINQALAQLADAYPFLQDPDHETARNANQCLFYPALTDRYWNLVFLLRGASYGTDGDIRTWCYDREEGALVTIEDALALAGTTREALCDGLDELVSNAPGFDLSVTLPVPLASPAQVVGFRIRADSSVVFYLSVTTDFATISDGGEYDPWVHLFSWTDGTYTRYDFSAQQEAPLVPAEECLKMDDPLWHQWYFNESAPRDGFLVPVTTCAVPGPFSNARDAYVAILRAMLEDKVLPDGRSLPQEQDLRTDEFALCDVDGDGNEELLLRHTAGSTAGHHGMVLDYDLSTGTVDIQLDEYPLLTFYDNGSVTAGWSHNQGWAGRFWPYTLYVYDAANSSYRQVGMVDAWDREISDQNTTDGFPQFPEELDTSHTGFLYQIFTNGRSYQNGSWVDAAVYDAWRDQYLGNASVLQPEYRSLTSENIQDLISR